MPSTLTVHEAEVLLTDLTYVTPAGRSSRFAQQGVFQISGDRVITELTGRTGQTRDDVRDVVLGALRDLGGVDASFYLKSRSLGPRYGREQRVEAYLVPTDRFPRA